jgi:hypothetical protein
MEAKELRIGNYVTEEVLGKCEVYEIHYDTVWVLVNNITIEGKENTRSFHLIINHLNPIPLTEEWLLKFGFENPLSSIFLNKSGWIISYEQHSFRWQTTPLEYVHQLQNLYFALTNDELDIKS